MPYIALANAVPDQIDGVSSIVVLSFAALAVIVLQVFFCWKWQNLLIELIPTGVGFGLIVTFFILMTRAATETLLETFRCGLVISAIMLGAVAVGWVVWFIYCIVHNYSRGNPAGY